MIFRLILKIELAYTMDSDMLDQKLMVGKECDISLYLS